MWHTIHQGRPNEGQGPEIARTHSWAQAQQIAITLSKAYPLYTFTIVNGTIDRITKYKGGEYIYDMKDGRDVHAATALIEKTLDYAPCASAGRHLDSARHSGAECQTVNPEIPGPPRPREVTGA